MTLVPSFVLLIRLPNPMCWINTFSVMTSMRVLKAGIWYGAVFCNPGDMIGSEFALDCSGGVGDADSH